MVHHTSFWTADNPNALHVNGEVAESLILRSLADNVFSAQAVNLAEMWEVQSQRVRRRKRDGESISEQRRERLSSGKLQCSREVKQKILSLLRSTGIPFRNPPLAEVGDHSVSVGSIPPASLNTILVEALPLKVMRTEVTEEQMHALSDAPVGDAAVPPKGISEPVHAIHNTSASEKAPTSALALLVAQAKAKHNASGAPLHESTTTEPQPNGCSSVSVAPQRTSNPSGNNHPASDTVGVDDDEEFGVMLPIRIGSGSTAGPAFEMSSAADVTLNTGAEASKHPSQMTREEFLSQFKRAPRQGEIGQSAEEIAAAEQLGYVMSGSRSKASKMYVDRIQRQLHEREASKLQQQFRKVEDERMDSQMLQGMLYLIQNKGIMPTGL